MGKPPTTPDKFGPFKPMSFTDPIVQGIEIDGTFDQFDLSGGHGKSKDQVFIGDDNSQWVIFGDGSNTAVMGAADDIAEGGAGSDDLSGGAGNDYLFGGAGTDGLNGGDGDDHLFGGDGGGEYRGGAGNDFLFGGEGADYFDGGLGDDYFDLSEEGTVSDSIDFFAYDRAGGLPGFGDDTVVGFDFETAAPTNVGDLEGGDRLFFSLTSGSFTAKSMLDAYNDGVLEISTNVAKSITTLTFDPTGTGDHPVGSVTFADVEFVDDATTLADFSDNIQIYYDLIV